MFNFYSPLEQFEVSTLIQLSSPIFKFNLTLTNLGLMVITCTMLLTTIHINGMNNLNLIYNSISIFLESIFATVLGMTSDQIGKKNEIYFPFIYALFTFILTINLMANVTYVFSATTSAIVCMGMSLMIFFGVTFLGFDSHGIHFLSFFVPAGAPLGLVPVLILIELMSYLASAVSLGTSLFANLTAGHSLMVILSGFLYQGFSNGFIMFVITIIPFGLFLAIVGLEIAVSMIQAYVWCVLTCIYIHDSYYLHLSFLNPHFFSNDFIL